MNKRIPMKAGEFDKYLEHLRDSMSSLSEYRQKTGANLSNLKDICKGLNHADPFIMYRASIAATLMLADDNIYH